jgi:hypothetical protein
MSESLRNDGRILFLQKSKMLKDREGKKKAQDWPEAEREIGYLEHIPKLCNLVPSEAAHEKRMSFRWTNFLVTVGAIP